jgi:iron complex outermembrane receptor protein
MRNKNLLLLTSALVALTATGGIAHAQSKQQAASQDNGTQVSDVIVTVNKRDQKIEDVPEAVTAVSVETRELQGIQTIQDFTNTVPSFTYTLALDRSFIRGVGRNTNAVGTDSGVAVYSDGFYTPSTYGLDRASIFSGTFEADAGPQGTLFGRNSIGGTLQVNTAHATDKWETQVDVKANDHARFDEAVTFGGPINDTFKILLGAQNRKQDKGYLHNLFNGKDQAGPTSERFYFGVLDYKFGSKIDGFLKFESSGFDRYLNGFGSYGSSSTGALPLTNDTTISSDSLDVNNFFNCLATAPSGFLPPSPFPTTRAANPCPTSFISPTTGLPTTNVPQTTTYYSPVNPAFTNPYNVNRDYRELAKGNHTYTLMTNNTWHGDAFDVKYIGGYSQYVYDNHSDQDGTARGAFQYDPDGPLGASAVAGGATVNLPAVTIFPRVAQYKENRKWSSHELDFSSSKPGPLQWITGLYFYRDNFDNRTNDASPGQTQLNLVSGNAAGNYYAFHTNDVSRSYAAFGQADYDITSKWKLTLGYRYSKDTKDTFEDDHYFTFVPSAANYNPLTGQYIATEATTAFGIQGTCNPANLPAITGNQGATCTTDNSNGANTRRINNDWTGSSGTANLQYKPNDDSLMYIKYSRGYKAGGIVLSTLTAQPLLKAESLDDFEAGYKFSPNRVVTVNAAAYYYNYLNYQDFASVANPQAPSGFSTVGFNIPKSQNYGLELTGDWHPIHEFTLTGSYSYTNAKVKDGGSLVLVDPLDNGNVAVNVTGNPLTTGLPVGSPGIPNPAAIGTVSTVDRTGKITTQTYTPVKCGTVQIRSALTGNVTAVQQGQCITGTALKGAPPNKFRITGDYRFDFDKGSLDLLATYNYRDGNVSSYFFNPLYKAPSYNSTDLRIVWSGAGKKYQVFAFVDNVFNKIGTEYVTAAQTSGVTFVNNQLTIPRSYGIELQAKF